MSVKHDITERSLTAAGFRVLHAGDDYDYQFALQRDGGVYDLTGATVRFVVKEDSVETDAQAKLNYDSGTPADIELVDAVNGVLTVHFKHADTQDLEGEWIYNLQVTESGGAVITFARGKIEFLPNIARTV